MVKLICQRCEDILVPAIAHDAADERQFWNDHRSHGGVRVVLHTKTAPNGENYLLTDDGRVEPSLTNSDVFFVLDVIKGLVVFCTQHRITLHQPSAERREQFQREHASCH
jgi:hypothetical protein